MIALLPSSAMETTITIVLMDGENNFFIEMTLNRE